MQLPFAAGRSGHHGGEMTELTGDELLALRVRLHGIELGRPADLLLDRELPRVVGIDVVCGDGVNRFLPLPTASVNDYELRIVSPLVLLEDQLAFYRSRTLALSALRRRPVRRRTSDAGILRDIVLRADGGLTAVIVELDGRTERLPFDDTIRFVPESRSAA